MPVSSSKPSKISCGIYSDQLYKFSVTLLCAVLPSDAVLSELLQPASVKPTAIANNAFGSIRPIEAVVLTGRWDDEKWVKISLLNKNEASQKDAVSKRRCVKKALSRLAGNHTIMVIVSKDLKGCYKRCR